MATLIDLSILFFAIIVVGGLILMSDKGFFKGFLKGLPQRKHKKAAGREWKERQPAAATTMMEMAEEVRPPQPQREEHPLPRPAEIHELPWRYGESRIVALARDPYWLFVYWEVSEATKAEIRSRFGPNAWEESQPVLRVYDISNVYFYDSRKAQEIMINDYANNWYINTGEPGRTYCVELGRLRPDGTYIFIARSNLVSMPRDRISEVIDYEWLLPLEYEKIIYGGGGAPSSPEFIRRALVSHEHIIAEDYVSSPMYRPQEQVSSALKW